MTTTVRAAGHQPLERAVEQQLGRARAKRDIVPTHRHLHMCVGGSPIIAMCVAAGVLGRGSSR
jgi:hypothetical protein